MSLQDQDAPCIPLDPTAPLVPELPDPVIKNAYPASVPQDEDSAVTKAEKFERHAHDDRVHDGEPTPKRLKLIEEHDGEPPVPTGRQKGVAPIKAE